MFDSIKGFVRSKSKSAPHAPQAETEKQSSSAVSSAGSSAPDTEDEPALAPPQPRVIDWRVLVVGGDAFWFGELERELLLLQPSWLCEHVKNGAEAEEMMASVPFDGLIINGLMPDVGTFLNKLQDKIDRLVCLVRCNLSDRATVAQWNRIGMTPVSEDSDAAALVASLQKTDRLRTWLSDASIKKLLPQLRKLPITPDLHAQVTEHLQSPNGSINTVALLISQDPVMSAKLLQIANSALFARAMEVTDTAEAVMILGVERIRSLILLAGIFSQYGEAACSGFSPEPIWSHSIQVGVCARAITYGETKDARLAEAAFTAGLLHDIGKLILAGNLPKMYEAVLRQQEASGLSQWQAEKTVLGTTHAELGACLLGTWGLPLSILEAIAWHHEPDRRPGTGFSLLAAVHGANVLVHEEEPGDGADKPGERIHLAFLLKAGLGDARNRWRKFCGFGTRIDEQTRDQQVQRRREVKMN